MAKRPHAGATLVGYLLAAKLQQKLPETRMTDQPTIEDFRYQLEIPLRWIDNDAYGHLNNARYYSLYENVIMSFLEIQSGLDPNSGETRCFTAENGCRYLSPIKYPGTTIAALRVSHIGNSSVRYDTALFDADTTVLVSTGFSVEIFVDAETERPTRIPENFRSALLGIATPDVLAALDTQSLQDGES